MDTVESAMNAVRGGAKRLELCSALRQGSLWKSSNLCVDPVTLLSGWFII